jgi:hypothetical protein
MRYIKLFEDLTSQEIRRQTVLDYKKNKPIEIPFVKQVDEKTVRVECKERDWYVDFYFDSEDRLAAVDNPWDVYGAPDYIGMKIPFSSIKKWANTRTNGNMNVDTYYILDREAQKYNL